MDRYPPPYPPPLPIAAPVNEQGVVVADLLCRRCQYNLRTLPVAGRCPECGLSVGFSAQGDLLRFSDPAWVMTLRRGVLCILWGILVIVLGVVGSAVIASIEGEERDVSGVAAAVAGLLAYVLHVVGGWLLTTPDPTGLGEDRYGTARKLIRVTLAIGAAGQFLELVEKGFVVPPSVHLVFRIVIALANVSGLVGTFAELQYIAKLAARIPDERIAWRANFLKWSLLAMIGAFFVGAVCVGLLAGSGTGGFVCFGLFMLVALVALGVMYILMLDRLRRVLKEQAQFALQTWAGAAAAPQEAS
jgi:hypothetical protein